ncbi:SDR family NAD(P)-dependent oxidoreductase [Lentisphaera profundi]|uniref:SDR family NAD(P)-dependent oxidoreductase n=1 Tax=Lentisphaera profundi TaxID=1658616 RepID=A0ABY7W0P7_9BACT|nr:SDR family NAD(P)-dependent oxidoreductase [Lentisphaera profundi]WDE98995.1 SDR family NAD(P)-dependent oxidoreductase [Lentisphaera profundi]
MSTSIKSRVVWLCGASTGIGRALANELLSTEVNLIVSSREINRLNEFMGKAYFLKCDVNNQDDWRRSAQEVEKLFGRVDTFIYNAGDCEYIDVRDLKYDAFERVMKVNFLGMLRGLEYVLPMMRKGNHPHIVGVSSSVDYFPLPTAEAYGASKAALNYMLESLRVDLAPEGIDVSIVKPGFVKTPLTDKNDFPMPFIISAEEAGKRIHKGIQKRSHVIDFPRRFTWMIRLMGLMPSSIRFILSRRFSRR